MVLMQYGLKHFFYPTKRSVTFYGLNALWVKKLFHPLIIFYGSNAICARMLFFQPTKILVKCYIRDHITIKILVFRFSHGFRYQVKLKMGQRQYGLKTMHQYLRNIILLLIGKYSEFFLKVEMLKFIKGMKTYPGSWL